MGFALEQFKPALASSSTLVGESSGTGPEAEQRLQPAALAWPARNIWSHQRPSNSERDQHKAGRGEILQGRLAGADVARSWPNQVIA